MKILYKMMLFPFAFAFAFITAFSLLAVLIGGAFSIAMLDMSYLLEPFSFWTTAIEDHSMNIRLFSTIVAMIVSTAAATASIMEEE